MSHYTGLLEKISSHTANITIIGLGYVGLPLAQAFRDAGFMVGGIDTDAKQCEEIVRKYGINCTPSYQPIEQADVAIICVPTPLDEKHKPDLTYILNAIDLLILHSHPGMLVVLESTSYPGTTEEVLQPKLEEAGYTIGEDFFLSFSPERIDPGNTEWGLRNTPKLVSGVTENCRTLARALYGAAGITAVETPSVKVAEFAKILENTYRSVNIALINELAIIANGLGIDIWDTIAAAKTKPFGFAPFYPGPGPGGHCIPVDPLYLTWRAEHAGLQSQMIDTATHINEGMPCYVAQRVLKELKNRVGKCEDGEKLDATVLVLGVTYKADVADMRESASLKVIEYLQARVREVIYSDPYIKQLPNGMRCEWPYQHRLDLVDCVLILTPHSAYNWAWICEHAKLVFDTRNVTPRDAKNVVRL